jgi:drug/metabolite transporter (DMT)-like permease
MGASRARLGARGVECGQSYTRPPQTVTGYIGSMSHRPSSDTGVSTAARLAPYGFILLWSSSFVTARVGLALVSPLLFVGVRLVAAAALLGVFVAARGDSLERLRGRWHHLAIAGALVNGVTLSAFHVGMVTENVAVMALMQAVSPMLIAVAAVPLLDERLRPRELLGLVLGIVGVALVVVPRALQGPAGWGAIWLGLAGTIGLAAGTVYFGRFGRDVPLVAATAVQLAAGAAVTVALGVAFERPHAVWTPPAIAAVAWNVLAVSIGAMALYYYMLNRGTAGRVAANFYLIPGTVALLGWALFGERLTALALSGFALASLGVFLVARRPRPRDGEGAPSAVRTARARRGSSRGARGSRGR